MSVFLVLLVLGVIFAVAAVAAGHGGALGEAAPDRYVAPLPVGRMTAGDVERLRLGVGFRGYRMDEVDAVLDRLARELAHRDAEIVRLERMIIAPGARPLGQIGRHAAPVSDRDLPRGPARAEGADGG